MAAATLTDPPPQTSAPATGAADDADLSGSAIQTAVTAETPTEKSQIEILQLLHFDIGQFDTEKLTKTENNALQIALYVNDTDLLRQVAGQIPYTPENREQWLADVTNGLQEAIARQNTPDTQQPAARAGGKETVATNQGNIVFDEGYYISGASTPRQTLESVLGVSDMLSNADPKQQSMAREAMIAGWNAVINVARDAGGSLDLGLQAVQSAHGIVGDSSPKILIQVLQQLAAQPQLAYQYIDDYKQEQTKLGKEVVFTRFNTAFDKQDLASDAASQPPSNTELFSALRSHELFSLHGTVDGSPRLVFGGHQMPATTDNTVTGEALIAQAKNIANILGFEDDVLTGKRKPTHDETHAFKLAWFIQDPKTIAAAVQEAGKQPGANDSETSHIKSIVKALNSAAKSAGVADDPTTATPAPKETTRHPQGTSSSDATTQQPPDFIAQASANPVLAGAGAGQTRY